MSLGTHRALKAIVAVSALLLFATIALADPPPAPAPGKPTTKPKSVYDADPVLPAVRLDGVAFSDTIDFLRDMSHANIFVDSKRLEAAGIDRKTPITLNVKNVSFRKVVALILAQVGTEGNRPAFAPDGDVVIISTPAGLKTITDSAKAMATAVMSPALRAKLDRRLPEVKFDGVTLSDTLDFIRDVCKISIDADWKGLADAGVSRDVPITARLFNMSTGQALRILIAGLDSKKPIGVSVKDEKVIVGPVSAKK